MLHPNNQSGASKMSINFDRIDDRHAQEFADRAIDKDIVALNFRSLNPLDEDDLDDVFLLLIENPSHKNNGTLDGNSQQQLANTLRSGAWIFEGHRGVSVKPDSPRKNAEGKVIKYESPRGAGKQQLFVPGVSARVAVEIVKKIGNSIDIIDRTEPLDPEAEDTEFWDWFLSTDLPLVLTEGAKKAAALVSAGYPAIAFNPTFRTSDFTTWV